VGFFTTTNALSTSLIVVLTALIYSKGYVGKIKKYALSVTLISSMARAAIIAQAFTYMLISFFRSSYIFKLLIVFSLLFFVVVLIYINPLGILNDGSALSKIAFFSSAIRVGSQADHINLFFGFGASFSEIVKVVGVNGWSPHVPLLKAFFYYGLSGLVLYVMFILSILKLYKGMAFIVIVFFVCGLAGAPIYFPTLIVGYICLKGLSCEEIKAKVKLKSKKYNQFVF